MIPPPTREDFRIDVESVYDAASQNVALPHLVKALCRLLADARRERKEIADAFVRNWKALNDAQKELNDLRERCGESP